MPTTIRMPQLGESVAEGTIAKWLKAPGESVARDEPLAEVITDKVNAELPSPVAGVLIEILVPEGQTVPVDAELARIAAAGEQVERPAVRLGAPTGNGTSSPPDGQAGALAAPAERMPSADELEAGAGRRFFTPVVLRMAAEHGLDLATVQGTGAGGRVTKKDLEHVLEQRRAAAAAAAPPSFPAAAPIVPPTAAAAPEAPAAPAARPAAPSPDETWVELTPMRRAIAEHMVRSVRTAPHAWALIEADVTNLVRWRAQVLPDWQRREGFELTYLPFAIKAVVEALKDHPELNSQWGEDKIILKRRVHIGVAVSIPDGLIVPVIRDADQKSIAGLAYALRDLVERARSGKLSLQDVQGGTFTVNNPGALGSIMSQPIINQPQAAILTTEAIQKRPVVRDDAIAIRSMMNLCLSFDHRVLDGAKALAFLQAVKRRLEAYGPNTPLY